MSDESLEHKVSQAPTRGPHESEVSRLDRIEQLLKEVLFAVQGDPLRRILGLMQRQDKLEAEVEVLKLEVAFLKAGGKTADEKMIERAWDVFKLFAASIIGAAVAILTRGSSH